MTDKRLIQVLEQVRVHLARAIVALRAGDVAAADSELGAVERLMRDAYAEAAA